MKLLKKTSYIVSIIYILLIASLASIAYILLLSRTSEIEISGAKKNIVRFQNNLLEFNNELNKIAADWTTWDDLYDFTFSKSEKFVLSNLSSKALAVIKTNCLIITDSSNKIITKMGYDYRHEKSFDLSGDFINALFTYKILSAPSAIDDIKSGLFTYENKIYSIASRPILKSTGLGPPAGSLLFARYLDSTTIKEIGSTILQTVDLIPLDSTMPGDYLSANATLSTKPDTMVLSPLNDEKESVYTYIKDINGKNTIIYRSIMDRVELGIEKRGYIFYLFSITLLGSFGGIFLIIFLYKTIIKRLGNLSRYVEVIGTSNESNLQVGGNDELAMLAGDIKSMVNRLTQRTLELEVFSDISTGLLKAKDYNEIGHMVFTSLGKFGGIRTGGKLAVYDGQKDIYSIVYDIDQVMNLKKPAIPSSNICKLLEVKYYSGYVIKTLKPLLIEDSHSEFSLSIADIQKSIPAHSMVFYPLIFESKFIGIITFAKEPAYTFDQPYLQFLESVSHFVSMAVGKLIQDSHLHEAIKGMEESEEKFRTFIEQSSDGTAIIDETGKITEWNLTIEKITGLERKNVIGQDGWEIINSLLRPGFKSSIQNDDYLRIFRDLSTADTKENAYLTNEVEIITTSGEHKYILHSLFPIKTSRGFRLGSVIRDITQNIKDQQAIISSENRFRSLFEKSPTAMAITRDRIFIYVNKSFQLLYGYDNVTEIINQSVLNFIAPESHDILKERDKKRKLGEFVPNNYEAVGIKKDGSTFPYLIESASMELDEKPSIVVFIVDLSERKQAEEEMIKKQKLESVGTLAGGIAHDFNNILTSILGNIQIARYKGKFPPNLDKFLNEAEKATVRAKGLTQQLLTFSRGGAPIIKSCSIIDLLKETAEFSLRGSNVKYNLNYNDNLWNVKIDSGQISQVIQNIVINAKQAMPEGGNVSIKVTNEIILPENPFSLTEGNYVRVSISDSGKGIAEEDQSKIFDPYFTTKEEGHGLGLSVCYSIIKKHGGSIAVNSELNKGTDLVFYIPAEDIIVIEAEDSATIMPAGSGSILVMDDDDMIQELSESILSELGYNVTITDNGEEAIKAYLLSMEKDNKYKAVILDLTIPGGMGGKEVINKLLEIDPDVAAVVSSGYHNDPVVAGYKKFGFKAAISKPYDINEMSVILNRIISSKKNN